MFPVETLVWEEVPQAPLRLGYYYRARVPGGWLLRFEEDKPVLNHSGYFEWAPTAVQQHIFIPDPNVETIWK